MKGMFISVMIAFLAGILLNLSCQQTGNSSIDIDADTNFEKGVYYASELKFDKALGYLKKVPPDDENHRIATNLLHIVKQARYVQTPWGLHEREELKEINDSEYQNFINQYDKFTMNRLIGITFYQNNNYDQATYYLRKALSVDIEFLSQYTAPWDKPEVHELSTLSVDELRRDFNDTHLLLAWTIYKKTPLQNISTVEPEIEDILNSIDLKYVNSKKTYYFFLKFWIEWRKGNYMTALDYIKKLAPLESLNEGIRPLVFNSKASIFLEMKKYDEAFEVLKEARNSYQDDPILWFNYGMLYSQAEDSKYTNMDKAIEAFKEAIELNDSFPVFRSELSKVYFKVGNINNAIEEIKKALALSPDRKEYKELLKKYERTKAEQESSISKDSK